MTHDYPRAWQMHLYDRRNIDRTLKVEGGLGVAAKVIGSRAPNPNIFEAELISLMQNDRPTMIDLGGGISRCALLVKWEAEQTGDNAPTYTLTFQQVIAHEYSPGQIDFSGRRASGPTRADVVVDMTVSPPSITKTGPCPECGPHGNKGRVLLLESWVDCRTCMPDVDKALASLGFPPAVRVS